MSGSNVIPSLGGGGNSVTRQEGNQRAISEVRSVGQRKGWKLFFKGNKESAGVGKFNRVFPVQIAWTVNLV